ncbi:WVD2 family protein [bacterium]|nr:WVD2 family protein [bacterium]
MLEKIIKHYHKKIIFSFYGFLCLLTIILPFILLGFGTYFLIQSEEKMYGIVWIFVGLISILIAYKRIREIFGNLKYFINPKKFPQYVQLINSGIDPSIYDKELEDADIMNKLSKSNPVVITDNFIFGASQVTFFFFEKSKVIWAYEYNGNGIVFFDSNKIYGFTYFPTVDGNDILMEELKENMPYIYLGIDFDYQTIMHDKFDETVEKIAEERLEFLNDPLRYKEKKAEEERLKALEEEQKLKENENAETKDDEIQESSEDSDESDDDN